MSETMTFEEAMNRLEKIVERMEEGDIPLEEALGMYKEGMDYSKLCHDKLRSAEKELTKILTEDGEEDFHLQEEEVD